MKLLRDRSFVFLIVFNVVLIVYYIKNPGTFETLVWIYWFQSVIIGISTFISLRTLKDYSDASLKVNGQGVADENVKRGFSSWFFLFHFGFFHFVYLIFLFDMFSGQQGVDMKFLGIAVLVFTVDQTLESIRRARIDNEKHTSPGLIFFMPYMRIIPMHLTILLPKFFAFAGPMVIFLILKSLADIGMYLVTQKVYGSAEKENLGLIK